MHSYLAVDIGAESGRVVRGTLDGDRLRLDEVGRFPNGMISIHGRLHWNFVRLLEEMRRAFRACPSAPAPESVGVDSWGVDFALLGGDGSVLGMPVAYRDSRTDGMMEKFFEIIPSEKVYEKTGIQFMQLNTLFQLFAMSQQKSPILPIAKDLLLMPDLFHYIFSGEKTTEFSDATTTQLLNVHENDWDAELLEAAGVPPGIMQDVVKPGTIVGTLTREMQDETGLGAIPVIAPATHDTGSAIASVPASGDDWAYISSGTWSLMGIEITEPICTRKAWRYNFTNEGGVNGTYRFLKNIAGLWLVQRCRADFDGEYSYAELTQMADDAPAFGGLIDVVDSRFINPPSMPDAIAEACKDAGEPVPDTPGAFVRCALESLALEYRTVLDELRDVQDRPINRIHIVGGGTQNRLLCRMTADATGLPVVAGPIEATAIGNLIVQAQALGHLASLSEARALVRRSFEVQEIEPRDTDAWEGALERYKAIKVKK